MHQAAILPTVMDGSLKSGARGSVALVLPLLSQPYMKPVWPKQLVGTAEFPKNILLTWTSQSNMLLIVVTMEGRFCQGIRLTEAKALRPRACSNFPASLFPIFRHIK